MKFYIAADHRGFNHKEQIKNLLTEKGIEYEDLGSHELQPEDDYADYGILVGEKVAIENARGIVFCGSGVGVDVAANKVKGVRCGLGFNPKQVTAARHDDDMNVLSVPCDYLSLEEAKDVVMAFITTEFGNLERYNRRIEKIKSFEK